MKCWPREIPCDAILESNATDAAHGVTSSNCIVLGFLGEGESPPSSRAGRHKSLRFKRKVCFKLASVAVDETRVAVYQVMRSLGSVWILVTGGAAASPHHSVGRVQKYYLFTCFVLFD